MDYADKLTPKPVVHFYAAAPVHNPAAVDSVPGSYSFDACGEAEPDRYAMPCSSFEDVFEKVREGRAERALVPIANSSVGRVFDVLRLLPDSRLHIIGEHFMPIRHQLLGCPGARLSDVRIAESHPVALGQCRHFLMANNILLIHEAQHGCRDATYEPSRFPVAVPYPSPHRATPAYVVVTSSDLDTSRNKASVSGLSWITRNNIAASPVLDTAGAAAGIARQGDRTKAAIASESAGVIYALKPLALDIQDDDSNTTRFLIMARKPKNSLAPSLPTMTSLYFTVRNIPAALYKALSAFANAGCKHGED